MSTARTAAAQKTATPTITAVPTRVLQRQCECGAHAAGGECEDCKKQKGVVSRKASGHSASDRSAACEMSGMSPHLVAEALRSPGQPLDRDTRAFMESRFQHDFSAVRVHTDVRAAASARALRARAWTLGSDVAFAGGAYAPGTLAGRRLIAHELAHVVQQEHAPAPEPGTSLNISEPGDASEREAESIANHVSEAAPVAVRAHPEPDAIHRDKDDSDDKWWYIGGGLAGAALIAAIIYFKTRKDATNIDNPPDCGERQNKKITPAIVGARDWTAKALDRLRAFRSKPGDAANQPVRDSLMRRFHSADAAVVDKVERVIVHVQNKIAPAAGLKTACQTEQTASSCSVAVAFANKGINRITFCTSFFKKDNEAESVATVIHEMTHTLVGGAHIGDRGYERERRFGGGTEPNRMTTEETLANAESYSECVADLATGNIYGQASPTDVIECPDDWKEPIKEAMARAQRANINISSELAEQGAGAGPFFRGRWTAQHVQGDAPSADVAQAAFKEVDARLGGPVRIVCRTNPHDRCREGDVEWDDQPPALTLCASWKARPEPARATNLLAGLYGWIAKVERPAWRAALAQIAIDTLTSERFGPPRREDVFGSAAWTPDLIRFAYVPITPRPAGSSYQESATQHQRMSSDMKEYIQPDCHKSTLPLKFKVYFWIDKADTPRPGPITPLVGSLTYSYPQEQGTTTQVKKTDTSVLVNDKPGDFLDTWLTNTVGVTLDSNGPFVIDIQLEDPDSKTIRSYHDEMKVTPVVECPDAISGADPATPPTPDAISGADPATPPGPDAISGADPAAPPRPDATSGADPATPPRPDAISGADPAAPSSKPVRVQRAPDDTGGDIAIDFGGRERQRTERAR